MAPGRDEMRLTVLTRASAVMIAATLLVSCATPPPPAPVAPDARALALQHDTEAAVANYISAQLNADPVYYYRHVDVRVDEGVATLSGYVWDTQAIYRARKIASDVPGVTRVVSNDLRLERNGRDTGPAR